MAIERRGHVENLQQIIVALKELAVVLEALSTKLFFGKLVLLHHGAHSSVHAQSPLLEQLVQYSKSVCRAAVSEIGFSDMHGIHSPCSAIDKRTTTTQPSLE